VKQRRKDIFTLLILFNEKYFEKQLYHHKLINTMKKLLFAIAICGFALTSCGNKTKAASEEKACCSKEKTEAAAELKKDSSKCCAAKAECTKDSTATETKAECKKDSAAVVTEAKAD